MKTSTKKNTQSIATQSVIDLTSVYHSYGLFARKIWQILYPAFVKWGDVTRFDSFLCDLGILEKLIEKGYSENNKHDDLIVMYWYAEGSYTYLRNEPDFADHVYKIVVDFNNKNIRIKLFEGINSPEEYLALKKAKV